MNDSRERTLSADGWYRYDLVVAAAAALAPCLYFFTVLSFAVNVPVGDDYAILALLNDFHAASGMTEKLALIVSLHNEHRIVTLKLVAVLTDKFLASMDFRALILIGNIAFAAALYQFGKGLGIGRNAFLWALVLLLALQPQVQKLMFYPMAGFQAFVGLFFAVLYLRLLLQKASITALSLVYIAAVMTSGSGLFLILFAVPLLASQTRFKALALQLLIAFAVLYWSGFESGHGSPVAYVLQEPLQAIYFFLLLLGTIVSFPDVIPTAYPALTVVAGGLFLVFPGWLILMMKRSDSAETRAVCLASLVYALFLLMMIALIVVSRTESYREALDWAAADGRYRVYGILYAIMVGVAVLRGTGLAKPHRLRWVVPTLLLAVAFNVSSFLLRMESMHITATQREAAVLLYVLNDDPSYLSNWAVPRDKAVAILDRAIANGTYDPPGD